MRPILRKIGALFAARPELNLTEALFLRLLGLVYLSAFASFWPQIVGLVGANGIAPAKYLLAAVHEQYGMKAWLSFPTLFLFGVSDHALIASCIAGCAGALALLAGFYSRVAAALCWVSYLSLVLVGQPFSDFQWDALLLESGFLALFAGAPLLRWAYRFLLFRLMFESGIVKLTSHDLNWRNFHALRFHFYTQPLPTPLAYYFSQAPDWLLDGMTAVTLAIELFVPFLLFGPRRFRQIAVALFMLLQLVILLTGNYAFFNLLTLALCLWGLDDSVYAPLARWLKPGLAGRPALRIVSSVLLALLMFTGLLQVAGMLWTPFDRPASMLSGLLGPFQIVNRYGLFAVMTTERPEIIIEGSNDGEHWLEYSFRDKPGDLRRSLPLVAPHQPRLDWQMWFAALGTYNESSWMRGLLFRLLQGESSVLSLLESAPFPKPPKYIRALLYDYSFTLIPERRQTGMVWKRKLRGTWYGPVSLAQK